MNLAIQSARPPASSITFLASAYASWHRAQAARTPAARTRWQPVHPHARYRGG
jgi:hypothetical protein